MEGLTVYFEEHLEECFNSQDPGQREPIKMSSFLYMREQPMFYRYFLRKFVKVVVGVGEWKSRLLDKKISPDDLCTSTDEAYALVYIENIYDHCQDIFRKNGYKIPSPRRFGKKKRFHSNIPTKYTEGGIMFSDKTKRQKSKGWMNDGLKRFNELVDKVREDRMKNLNFMSTLVAKERKKLNNGPLITTSDRK